MDEVREGQDGMTPCKSRKGESFMEQEGCLLTASDAGEVNKTTGLEKGFATETRLVALRTHFLWRREETMF